MTPLRSAVAWLAETGVAACTLLLALGILYVLALETRMGGSLGGTRLLGILPVLAPACGISAFAIGERLRGERPSRARSALAAILGSAALGAAAVVFGASWLDFLGAFAGLALCAPGAALGLGIERWVSGA